MKSAPQFSSPRIVSEALRSNIPILCISFSKTPSNRQSVIEILRLRAKARDPVILWWSGSTDPTLWHALCAMLDAPGAPHRFVALAVAAGMSRPRFTKDFQCVYENPPMSFLPEFRLTWAAKLLSDGQVLVKPIAQLFVIERKSAFTRAFTTHFGHPPRAFRYDTKSVEL